MRCNLSLAFFFPRGRERTNFGRMKIRSEAMGYTSVRTGHEIGTEGRDVAIVFLIPGNVSVH